MLQYPKGESRLIYPAADYEVLNFSPGYTAAVPYTTPVSNTYVLNILRKESDVLGVDVDIRIYVRLLLYGIA